MSTARVPHHAEIFMSYLVATNEERTYGIFLLTEQRQIRSTRKRKRFMECDLTEYEKYKRCVLNGFRLRPVKMEMNKEKLEMKTV